MLLGIKEQPMAVLLSRRSTLEAVIGVLEAEQVRGFINQYQRDLLVRHRDEVKAINDEITLRKMQGKVRRLS